MKLKIYPVFIVFLLSFSVLNPVFSSEPLFKSVQTSEQESRLGLFVERLRYEDRVYSKGKKTELGDSVELEASLRYQLFDETFFRFRFETDPSEDRFGNKTSRFELLGAHRYRSFGASLDVELNTDESSSGGTTIGLDLDSEKTVISYFGNAYKLSFFPFNFGGKVGKNFETDDVTEVFFIDGAPAVVSGTPGGGDQIASKTIPGIELRLLPELWGFSLYAGVGLATYEYPTNESFDIQNNPSAPRWEKKEDLGYKFGFLFSEASRYKVSFDFVGHTESEEGGALLEQAASLQSSFKLASWIISSEFAYSKAGAKAWRVNRDGTWFEETAPFQPIYSELISGDPQNWLGKEDYAISFELGYSLNDTIPYLLYRHLGEHFIYDDFESAHRLRTADESLSHGGLNVFGVGSYFYFGNYSVNPEFEWRSAQNAVFGNASDVRDDRLNASFEKNDFLVTLKLEYNFQGVRSFEP